MKIVVIAGFAASLVNFRGALLKAMVAAGHDVIACAPHRNPEISRKLHEMRIHYRSLRLDRTGMNPFKDIAGLLQLYVLLRRTRPDLVLNYTIKPVIYGSFAASAAGVGKISSIITGLGYAFTEVSLVNQIVQRLYRFSLRRNNVVFFQNRDDLEEFRRIGVLKGDSAAVNGALRNAAPRTVVVNGSGVDLEYFRAMALPNCGTADAGAPHISGSASVGPVIRWSSAPVFLLIARLLRNKGILEYVAAAQELKLKHPRVTFRLLGPFDSNPAALTPDEIEQLSSVIEYLGEVDDVRPHLRQCDVYVLPSYREGTPRTVLEAMAIGRPIVTTDAPGCRETIRRVGSDAAGTSVPQYVSATVAKAADAPPSDVPSGVTKGDNGFLVPVRNAKSLTWAMEQFILHPELIQEMGRRSREYAEERYDVHKVNAVILKEIGIRA